MRIRGHQLLGTLKLSSFPMVHPSTLYTSLVALPLLTNIGCGT